MSCAAPTSGDSDWSTRVRGVSAGPATLIKGFAGKCWNGSLQRVQRLTAEACLHSRMLNSGSKGRCSEDGMLIETIGFKFGEGLPGRSRLSASVWKRQ